MFTYATKLNIAVRGRGDQSRAPDSPWDFDDVTRSPSGVTSSNDINSTSGPSEKMTLTRAEHVGYMFVMPIICCVGIILNILVIIVLRRRSFRSPTYTFLCALATADIITLVFTLPGALSRCDGCPGLALTRAWVVFEVFVFIPITNMSECLSSWLTCILAVERLLAIKIPMLDRGPDAGKRRSRTMITLATLASVILNIPYFYVLRLGDGLQTEVTRFGAGVGFVAFSWIRASLVQLLPLVVLIVLNVMLALEVRKSQRRCLKLTTSAMSSAREQAQMRLTAMLTGTVAMFIAGHIPVALAYTVIFSALFGKESLRTEFYSTWLVVTHCCALLSYAMDFVVYCVLNKYFRQACVTLLSCDRQKRKVSDVATNSTSGGKKEPRY